MVYLIILFFSGSLDGSSRFPKLEECAHFHYDFVEFGPVQVRECHHFNAVHCLQSVSFDFTAVFVV